MAMTPPQATIIAALLSDHLPCARHSARNFTSIISLLSIISNDLRQCIS